VFKKPKEPPPVVKFSQPPPPKPPTILELLKIRLSEIDALINGKREEYHAYLRAKSQERNAVQEEILFLELTPRAEEYMKAIWDQIKPR
jgi:hypothetical protein